MDAHIVQIAFRLSLIVFMVGNLLVMGLQIQVAEALVPLRNREFVLRTLIGCFVLGPSLAYILTLAIPMERPYAIGVLLLGMAPAAPFVPLVVKRADGDLAVAACFMLLASIGTIVVMPLGVPLVAQGLSASAWSVARPLLFLVLLPLGVGMAIRYRSPVLAEKLYPPFKAITAVGTIVFLVLVVVLNFRSFIGAIGSHAFLVQLIYVPALGLCGYFLGTGFPRETRSVMSLGLCTRNIGAAAAIVGSEGDQRIMVMLVIATLVTVLFSFASAARFAKKGRKARPHKASEKMAKI